MPVSPSNGGPQFYYHGTTEQKADGILHEGARPSGGMWGPGVYSADNERYAQMYANKDWGTTGVVLRGTTDANVKHFESHAEIRDYLRDQGKDPYDGEAHLTRLLSKQGYGGMYSKEDGILATFDHGSFRPEGLRSAGEPWTDLT